MTEGKKTIEDLEREVNELHAVLQERGINTVGTSDIFGRKFDLPVSSAPPPPNKKRRHAARFAC